ncbi:hypothetical protein HerbRD11066_04720 [Herbidospora sp. RD11066]
MSIASSVPFLALFVIVVGGLFSDTRLSVNGWPGDRRGGVADLESPSPVRKVRPSRTEQPTPSVSATAPAIRPAVVTTTPAVSPSASPRPALRPKFSPGALPWLTPAPSREPEESPGAVSGSDAQPTPDLSTDPTPPDGSDDATPTTEPTTGGGLLGLFLAGRPSR